MNQSQYKALMRISQKMKETKACISANQAAFDDDTANFLMGFIDGAFIIMDFHMTKPTQLKLIK